MHIPQAVLSENQVPISLGATQFDIVAGDQVGGSYYEHKVWGEVLDDLVDGLEVRDVFLSEVFALIGCDWLAEFLGAVYCAMQEYYW